MTFAVLKDTAGKNGDKSLTSWASVPFQTFDSSDKALAECIRVNKICKENGVNWFAYVAEGEMTESGFYPS